MKSLLVSSFLILFCLASIACNNEKMSPSESGMGPKSTTTISPPVEQDAIEAEPEPETAEESLFDLNPIRGIRHAPMNDGSVNITTVIDDPENWMFAWYIFDQDSGKIHQQWYVNDNTFKYTFPKSGNYRIQAFVKNDNEGFNKFSEWFTIE